MKIRLDTVLKDFDGEPLKADLSFADLLGTLNAVLDAVKAKDPAEGAMLEKLAQGLINSKKRDLTLRSALYMMSSTPLQESTTGDREMIFAAAVGAIGRDEMELKAEEVTVLKKTAGTLFRSPLVQGQVCQLLEGIDPFAQNEPAAVQPA